MGERKLRKKWESLELSFEELVDLDRKMWDRWEVGVGRAGMASGFRKTGSPGELRANAQPFGLALHFVASLCLRPRRLRLR